MNEKAREIRNKWNGKEGKEERQKRGRKGKKLRTAGDLKKGKGGKNGNDKKRKRKGNERNRRVRMTENKKRKKSERENKKGTVCNFTLRIAGPGLSIDGRDFGSFEYHNHYIIFLSKNTGILCIEDLSHTLSPYIQFREFVYLRQSSVLRPSDECYILGSI